MGLFYVGAVLFLNGMMLLGKVDARAVGLFNLFVGCCRSSYPPCCWHRPAATRRRRWPPPASTVRLYPYVGLNLLTGADSTGVGYYSLFVAISALGFSFVNFRIVHDRPFGVIWLYWSFLWFLFFLLLGLKWDRLTVYTGWVTAVEGWVTAAIPAFLILAGYWKHTATIAVLLAGFGVLMAVGCGR